jgi:hypothetical protein
MIWELVLDLDVINMGRDRNEVSDRHLLEIICIYLALVYALTTSLFQCGARCVVHQPMACIDGHHISEKGSARSPIG